MKPTPKPHLPNIKKCISYIESCGWKFSYYNRPWYVFTPITPRTDNRTSMPFTLTEIRDAFTNGW